VWEERNLRRRVYTIVFIDVIALVALALVALNYSARLVPLGVLSFLVLYGSNYFLLRRKVKAREPSDGESETVSRSNRAYLYLCSAIFSIGSVYGVLMVMRGELPWAVLVCLPVPLSIAIFTYRLARRTRESGPVA